MKKKVLIAVHQLNLGGVQKALISALNAIDYSKNDVVLYIRKNRTDLIESVNKNVSKIIINKDNTKYYRKPYSLLLLIKLSIAKLFGKNTSEINKRLNDYIVDLQMKYEKEHYFSDDTIYDVAISYIQSHTAKFVSENIKAKKKIMFYHGSTDEFHEINEAIMSDYEKIYCVSKGALASIAKCYPEFSEKMDYIENYVDYESIKKNAQEFKPDYPENKLILCSCGRITPVKGYDLAVEAAEILKANNIDFKWYFVGDGTDRAKIEDMIASKNLSDNIVITGLKDNPHPYVKNCDIYVQPSYEESFGLTIYEAMILNKIVVTTSTVGAQEIVTNEGDGIIADISSKSIAQKIQYVLENEKLENKIKKVLEQKNYSKEYDKFSGKWKKLLGD